MPTLPETKFTQSGDLSIAYQVLGHGPFDLLIVPGFISHLEEAWEDPSYARFLHHLASFSRLIQFDKRGTGLSDRLTEIPTLEQRIDDVRAVMDATRSKRAALFGISEGGPMSILFAATYPERVSALVLYGSLARLAQAPDYPWGSQLGPRWENWLEGWRKEWGGPYAIDNWAPSMAQDDRFCRWWAKYLRLSASPSAIITLFRMNALIDVREVLPVINVPTLILHRRGDRAVEVEHSRYLAAHIKNSKLVELNGDDHLWWVGDSARIVSEIREFLTGERESIEQDRVLATVLFTDIVNSTQHASELGDQRWRELLDQHNSLMETQVHRFRGRLVKNTGDGILATFDGPGRAILCACSATQEVSRLGIQIRSGLHTGEVELIANDVRGIAVHTAARVAEKARPNEVWISRTVQDLVAGSRFRFSERGSHELKGLSGNWPLFAVDYDASIQPLL